MWAVTEQLVRVSSPLLSCESQGWTQVLRFGDKCHYLLNLLVVPQFNFLREFFWPPGGVGAYFTLPTSTASLPPRWLHYNCLFPFRAFQSWLQWPVHHVKGSDTIAWHGAWAASPCTMIWVYKPNPHPNMYPRCYAHMSNRGYSSGLRGNHTDYNTPVSQSA